MGDADKSSDKSASDSTSDDPAKKKDLRFTNRVDFGVSIDRDMSAGGRLARGDHTKMSNLSFNVQAKSRDYLDPELQALHADPESVKPKHVRQAEAKAAAEAGKVEEPAPQPVVAPPAEIAAKTETLAQEKSQSVLGRFTDGLRRWMAGH